MESLKIQQNEEKYKYGNIFQNRDISHLSPYHERVSIQKKHIKKKQQLRSILIMGHLQKMQLNAINNRSLQTMVRAKKAQQMSKRRVLTLDNEEKQMKSILKIDNRKKLKRESENNEFFQKLEEKEQIQKVYESMIDEYLKKASQNKTLQNMDRKSLIQDACKVIHNKLANRYKNVQKSIQNTKLNQSQAIKVKQLKQRLSNSQENIPLPVIKQQIFKNKKILKSERSFSLSQSYENEIFSLNLKNGQKKKNIAKNSYRNHSITQIECNENLKMLQMQRKYLTKQRNLEEKMFLRKMRMIGLKNIRSFKLNAKNLQKEE